MLSDIVNSCTHPRVAEAAVLSMGPGYAHQVKAVARSRGMALGAYASGVVRRFHEEASPATRQALRAAMRAADQPILAGMAFVLELAMDGDRGIQVAPRRSINTSSEALCPA